MKMNPGILCSALLLAAGCFTISQSEFPSVALTQVNAPKVQVEGFQSSVIDYTPIFSTSTYMVDGPGWYGGPHRRRPWHGPYMGSYTTATYMPTLRNTDVFLQRAMTDLEKSGCILRAQPAKYTVSGSFNGPVYAETAGLKSLGVFLGSILSARFEMVTYLCDVKVYEVASGKLVFSQSYAQDYFASGWSPIPIFGIMEFEKVEGDYMRTWCLSALVDRAMADVTRFLSEQK